jgi:hypothetical protein
MNSGGEKYGFFYMPLFTLTIGECIRHSNGGFSIIIYYESVCRFWGLDGLEAGRCNMQSINQSPFRSCKNSRGRGREKNLSFYLHMPYPLLFVGWLTGRKSLDTRRLSGKRRFPMIYILRELVVHLWRTYV